MRFNRLGIRAKQAGRHPVMKNGGDPVGGIIRLSVSDQTRVRVDSDQKKIRENRFRDHRLDPDNPVRAITERNSRKVGLWLRLGDDTHPREVQSGATWPPTFPDSMLPPVQGGTHQRHRA